MSPITNLAGYRFIPVEEPEKWKSQLLPLCRELGLKGTILLATEGINFFLAGTRPQLDPVLAILRS
ncbi:MAG: sulfurtransferase, partial [Verrucomicrobia bacterium]|nr:sulfurtransferase [Verrucomicrobiota bacterium]